jgi:hypothetical protein
VTSALEEPDHGTEVDEFEARLQHAVEALTMEVGLADLDLESTECCMRCVD